VVFSVRVPDFSGYELESHIYSSFSRIVVLWFGKIEPETESWRQIQVTLVNSRLRFANVEIAQSFPPMRSCEVFEIEGTQGKKLIFQIAFNAGEVSFECEDITYNQYSRRIRIIRNAE
jgi:hypothetical protein